MIPALFDVEHKSWSTDGEDEHGNPIEDWSAPVMKKFVTWADYSTSEPKLAGHDRDVVDAGIIVYPDFGVVNPGDRMTIDGQEFDVVGHVERNDKAWWSDPQVLNWVINLRAVSG